MEEENIIKEENTEFAPLMIIFSYIFKNFLFPVLFTFFMILVFFYHYLSFLNKHILIHCNF